MEGDTFYANVPDANDDKKVDFEDDGKIPGTDGNGNIMVYNPGNIGSQIIFDYNDPGYGLASDPDCMHDFDAFNQVMSFLTGMTFGKTCQLSLSQIETSIDAGEQACITVSNAYYLYRFSIYWRKPKWRDSMLQSYRIYHLYDYIYRQRVYRNRTI